MNKKKLLSWILAITMIVSAVPFGALLPATALAASTGFTLTITHTGLSSLDDLKDASGNTVPLGTIQNITPGGLVSTVSNIDNATEYIYRFTGGTYYNQIAAASNPNRRYLDSIVIKMGDVTVLDSRTAPAYSGLGGAFPTQNTGNAGAVIGTGSSNNVWIQTASGNTGVRFNNVTPDGDISVEFNWHVDADPNAAKYTATVADSANGSIEPLFLENDGANAVWELTATPNTGYMLDYWEWTSVEGDWTNATKIQNDLLENDKTTIIETLTENRWYRAVFKPWQFIMPGGAAITSADHLSIGQGDSFLEKHGYASVYAGTPLPAGEGIRSGRHAVMNFSWGLPCSIVAENPEEDWFFEQVCLSAYAGDCVADSAAEPFLEYTVDFRGNALVEPIYDENGWHIDNKIIKLWHNASAGGFQIYIPSLPNAAGITVEFSTPDGSVTTRKYYELTIVTDTLKEARDAATAGLWAYYETVYGEPDTSNDKTGQDELVNSALYKEFAPVRMMLRNEVNRYLAAIDDVPPDAEASEFTAILARAKTDLARIAALAGLDETGLSAGQPEYPHKKLAVFAGGTIAAPAFAYINMPSDAIYSYDANAWGALKAAMENGYPGTWFLVLQVNGLESSVFLCDLSISGGGGVYAGTTGSSNICYTRNGGYADGFSIQTVDDRDVIILGPAELGMFPDLTTRPNKDDLVWALAALHGHYGVARVPVQEGSDVKRNELIGVNEDQQAVFAEAMKIIAGWDVPNYGKSAPKDVKQKVVDDALDALKEAFPDINLEHSDLPEAVLNTIKLIRAIGDVDPTKGGAIAAARNAYDALDQAEKEQIINYANLTAAEAAYELLKSICKDLDVKLAAVLGFIYNNVTDPAVASIGGEWAVLALARSESITPQGAWAQKYLSNLNAELAKGGLDAITTTKYTEFSRITLALSAMGIDASAYRANGGTYDFTAKLMDFDQVVGQGINGPVFALLALNARPYAVGNAAIRNQYINYILDSAVPGGGWSLTDAPADTDVTAMVIQALAPYYETDANVKAAVDRALTILKNSQDKTSGGFYSMGQYNSESASQVIVALTALGLDPASWAVNGEHTPITALLQFYSDDTGGFKHLLNAGADGMATEQAAYALVAYSRYLKGRNTLYDMSDAGVTDEQFDRQKADAVITLIDAVTEPVTLKSEAKIMAAVMAYNLLNPSQKQLVTNYSTLQSAISALSKLKVAECERLINAIGKVSLESKEAIVAARIYYTSLSKDEQAKVANYDALLAAEKALKVLKDAKDTEDAKEQKPGGKTTAVTLAVDRVEYVLSEETKAVADAIQNLITPPESTQGLPEDFSSLTDEQIDKILGVYRLYDALTDEEKLFVENYEKFEAILERLGDKFHYDAESSVDLRGNEGLPWHVKVNVAPRAAGADELNKIRETLGDDANVMILCEISFTDMLTGRKYEPNALVTVRIPVPDSYDGSTTLVVVHIKDDGSYEYIECTVVDGYAVFSTSNFSLYGLAAFTGSLAEIISPKEDRSLVWLWIALIVVGVLGIGAVLVMKRRQGSEAKERA